MSIKSVHDTHKSEHLRTIHDSLLTIVGVMNRPQNDEKMVQKAGINLDRALFPLLVGIERLGPIGVVDLAERAGRDYTTVSRQVSKLEKLGFIKRKSHVTDKRVNNARITLRGKALIEKIDSAREEMGLKIFESWTETEFNTFVRLIKKFADDIKF